MNYNQVPNQVMKKVVVNHKVVKVNLVMTMVNHKMVHKVVQNPKTVMKTVKILVLVTVTNLVKILVNHKTMILMMAKVLIQKMVNPNRAVMMSHHLTMTITKMM